MSHPVANAVVRLSRQQIQAWLPDLDRWLLPDCTYSVHHTWPLLYRSDGHGKFFAVFDGDRLVSHCATRDVIVRGATGPFRATLLGSVATDPACRGRGLATQVIEAALEESRGGAEHVLLWAERATLYARVGFEAGVDERCLLLGRRPSSTCVDDVRPADVADHTAIHELHCNKPWRVERTPSETSGLMTTPGMTTMVRERDGRVVAYACCGKGADLQDHWHEFGGDDEDVAALVQAAMHACGQIEAVLLLPPYRPHLVDALGPSVVDEFSVCGPMSFSRGHGLPACWIDGLDSV